jgi:hypothetical protein
MLQDPDKFLPSKEHPLLHQARKLEATCRVKESEATSGGAIDPARGGWLPFDHLSYSQSAG